MEHIKIIEKLITRCEECKLKECMNCEISWTEVDAIKKLLNKKGSEKEQIIELGEYIRNKDGYIGKVENIIEPDKYLEDIYYCCGSVMSSSYKNEITKHSPNIIDLVEVGDFINKAEITSIQEKDEFHKERIVWHETFYGDDDLAFTNADISTILTHELYEENCYRVGGKNEI